MNPTPDPSSEGDSSPPPHSPGPTRTVQPRVQPETGCVTREGVSRTLTLALLLFLLGWAGLSLSQREGGIRTCLQQPSHCTDREIRLAYANLRRAEGLTYVHTQAGWVPLRQAEGLPDDVPVSLITRWHKDGVLVVIQAWPHPHRWAKAVVSSVTMAGLLFVFLWYHRSSFAYRAEKRKGGK